MLVCMIFKTFCTLWTIIQIWILCYLILFWGKEIIMWMSENNASLKKMYTTLLVYYFSQSSIHVKYGNLNFALNTIRNPQIRQSSTKESLPELPIHL